MIQEEFAAIRGMLQESKVQLCEGGKLTIEEKGKQATLKSINIGGVGSGAFSIKYDECGFPGYAVFATHKNLHRACDSIAFCHVDATPYILCLELKSSEPTRHEVTEQFLNAHCFLEYLGIILKHYKPEISIATWERRYFVFHGCKDADSKPPLTDVRDNLSPDNPLFMPATTGHSIYARKLLGKPL